MKYKYDYTLASRMNLFMYEEMATPSTESTLPPAKKMVKTSAKDVDKYSTVELITFLQEQNSKQNLGLLQEDYDKLNTERINGHSFLVTSREEFQGLGLKFGPTRSLAKLAEDIRNDEQYIADSPFFGHNEADDTYDEADDIYDEADENDELPKIEDLDITGQEDEYSHEIRPSSWTSAKKKLQDLCSAKIIRVNDELWVNKKCGSVLTVPIDIGCKVTSVDDGKLDVVYNHEGQKYKVHYETSIKGISSLSVLEKIFLDIRKVPGNYRPQKFKPYRDIKIVRDGKERGSVEYAIEMYRQKWQALHSKNNNKS